MSERKVKDWITMNGKHIPIFEGESKNDAINRSIAKDNEDKKESDIAKRNKQIEEANKDIDRDAPPNKIGRFWNPDSISSALQWLKKHPDAQKQVLADISGSDKRAIQDVIEDGWAERFDRYDSDVAERFLTAYEKMVKDKNEHSKHLKTKSNKLEDRLKGDALLDAKDMIEELKANKADIDENGYVTVYHRTNDRAYNEILKSGIMKAKEDGVFFSTKKSGYADNFGDKVIMLKVPVEKFVIDDEFGDEAHLRIPLKNRNATLDISEYLKRR